MFWQEVPVHTLLKSPKIFYTFKSKIGNVCYKGQKISKANYGVLNSSKKQTKSEKEFDLKDPKAIFFFFSFVFLKNWGRHKLVSRFFDLWYQIVMIPPKLLSLAEKPTKPVLQKSFFFDSIVFKWDSFDKSSLVMAMVVVFLYVVSCGLHSPAYWTLKIICAHLKISWISVLF